MYTKARWRANELEGDKRWILKIDSAARSDLLAAVKQAPQDDDLLAYTPQHFDLGRAGEILRDAVAEVREGRGVAVVRGLPREELTEQQFALLTWAIGLHIGVARPQGAATPYLCPVRDTGTVYRSGRGRGYSSNAQLDYHTDSADYVLLSCYNRAASGGLSLTTSTLAAYDEMAHRHPTLVRWLHVPLHFSRQGEQAPDEGPTCEQPVYGEAEGRLVCRWNWNRVNTAQDIPGIPKLHPDHRDALMKYDEIVRKPELVHDMWMEPGDVQIINSHVTLHSRTEFIDNTDEAKKRLMFRLWIAPPDSQVLPQSWKQLYREIEAGAVRGGIRGSAYDDRCESFERRQAAAVGSKFIQ